jgi:polysaccharide biosynthesis/export protein
MRVFYLICIALILTSCTKVLVPERMFHAKNNYSFEDISTAKLEEYRIAPNDKLSFILYTNDGEKLIDPIENMDKQTQMDRERTVDYLVEYDGTVKLPVIGRQELQGMTLREAESYLEQEYTKYYNNPFVQLRVTNMRVVVFPGGEKTKARVVILSNPNTTLIEALAEAGGIIDGKAHSIRIIRGNPTNTKVYSIDLSKISEVELAGIVLQANDIIYVEPRARYGERIIQQISPYLTIFSTALIIYGLVK